VTAAIDTARDAADARRGVGAFAKHASVISKATMAASIIATGTECIGSADAGA
jgi:hypothetical protein